MEVRLRLALREKNTGFPKMPRTSVKAHKFAPPSSLLAAHNQIRGKGLPLEIRGYALDRK